MSKRLIIAIGDLHGPWTDQKCLDEIYRDVSDLGPTDVVQLGDLYDMFSFTRFARTHDICTPKQEIEEARQLAENFWKNIRKLASRKTAYYQLLGNHDVRPSRRLMEKMPEIASLLDVRHLFRFPGVTTIDDDRKELKIDDILFMHGYRSQLGAHARFNQMKTVCGHSHTGGVVFFPISKDRILWECNAGFVADREAVPLGYTPQTISRWTKGRAIIDERGPRFCPIQT